jgi:type IV pilus assembly protein PilW
MKGSGLMAPGRQHGFSLVEIMVAMVLGIVILLAVSEVFISNSRTRGEIEKTGRQIENGIYALRLMEDELANAGFWGEAGAQPVSAGLPPLCPTTATELEDAMGYPVQGAADSGTDCENSKANSDFIALRRASTCAVGTTGCALFSSGNFHIQVSACKDVSPGSVKLEEDSGLLTYTQRDCSTAAPVYRLFSRVYYVNDSDELVRAELASGNYNTVTSLVDGIEIMRFEYGIDTDGDAQIDEFTAAPTTAQWPDVVAAKVSLIARNPEPTAGYTDSRSYTLAGEEYEVPEALRGFKRQLYSTTVHLRNVAGRREVP